MDKESLIKEIDKQIISLKNSPLYFYRTKHKYYPVIGEGSLDARIMFIGEAPGKNEALTGRPFCGASGRVLDELLHHINLNRKDIYITNIVKDRPPENRDPTEEEIVIYSPFLNRQIEIIKPKVIATLGRYSMKYIMQKFGLTTNIKPISKIHGEIFDVDTSFGRIKIIPLYHPAVSVYNGNTKKELKTDFEKLKKLYEILQKDRKGN